MTTRDEHLTDLEIVDGRVVAYERGRLVLEFNPERRPEEGALLAASDLLVEVVASKGVGEVVGVSRRGDRPALGTVFVPGGPILLPTFASAAGGGLSPLGEPMEGGEAPLRELPLLWPRGSADEPARAESALVTGWTGLDLFAPLPVGGGLALVTEHPQEVSTALSELARRVAARDGARVLWVGKQRIEAPGLQWVQIVEGRGGSGEWAAAGRAALTLASSAGEGQLVVVFDRPESWLESWAKERSGRVLASLDGPALLRDLLYRLFALPRRTSVCAIFDASFLSPGRGELVLAGQFESVAHVSAGGIIDPSRSVTRLQHPRARSAEHARGLLVEASEIRQHIAIFGEEDLEPEQWDLLERTATLTRLFAQRDAIEEVEKIVSGAWDAAPL
jgi:hypothetical protein